MSIKYLDNNGLATLWSKIKALITTASIADIGSPSSYNNITNIRVANEINKGLWIDLGERIINTSNNSIDFTASCFLFDPITQTQTEVDFNQLFQSSEILPPIYLIGSGDLIFETAAEAIYNIRININNSGYKYLTGLPTNRRASAAVDPLGSQYLKYENFGETGGEYRLFNNTLYKLKKTNIRIDGWYEDCWGITEMLFSPNILESYYTPLSDGIASVGYSTNYARADHIHPSDTSRAPIASPQFTGTPTAPTASTVVNNTQLATTQFVHNLMSTIPTYSVATTATDGLMSAQDKIKLDNLNISDTYSASSTAAMSGIAVAQALSGPTGNVTTAGVGMETPDSRIVGDGITNQNYTITHNLKTKYIMQSIFVNINGGIYKAIPGTGEELGTKEDNNIYYTMKINDIYSVTIYFNKPVTSFYCFFTGLIKDDLDTDEIITLLEIEEDTNTVMRV